MTDKADIEALRGEVPAISNLFEAGKFIAKVLDQLEAERKRADKAESYARERDSENESIALTVGRLRLELAELRGEQEPVAYLTRHVGCRSPDDCEEYLELSDKDGVSGKGDAAIPVFTRQPKSVVVLPPRKFAKDYVDDEFTNADLAAIYNAARLELKVKIQNAGIVVKDGE